MQMSQLSRRPSANGFTLVELLVVIGIIAVLIAILMPALSRAMEASKRIVCLSNMRQVYIDLLNYSQANNDVVPLFYNWSDENNSCYLWLETTGYTQCGFTNWGYLYAAGNMQNGLIYYCPSEMSMPLMYDQRPGVDWNDYNQWPPGRWEAPGSPPNGTAWGNSNTRSSYCLRPVEGSDTSDAYTTQWFVNLPQNEPKMSNYGSKAIIAELLSPTDILRRHGTGINVVYGDGSGSWIPYSAFENDLNQALSYPQYTSQRNQAILTVKSNGDTNVRDSGVWADLDR